MQRDDDQPLWDLLGRAKTPPAVTPFFARNVLRSLRAQPPGQKRAQPWFCWRRLVPAGALAGAVLAAGLMFQRTPVLAPHEDAVPDAIAQLDEVDFEVVADLDDLLALEEDNLWSDGEVSSL